MKKICSICKTTKLLESFGARTVMRDGHRSECKACMAADAALRRQSDPERAKEVGRRFYKRHRKARIAAAQAYRRANPERSKASDRHQKRIRWAHGLVTSLRSRAVRAGLSFELTPEFLHALHAKQEGRCYWLGVPIVVSDKFRDPQRPSVDRLDPTKGYTQDNVVLTCMYANLGRSTNTVERTKAFVALLRQAT